MQSSIDILPDVVDCPILFWAILETESINWGRKLCLKQNKQWCGFECCDKFRRLIHLQADWLILILQIGQRLFGIECFLQPERAFYHCFFQKDMHRLQVGERRRSCPGFPGINVKGLLFLQYQFASNNSRFDHKMLLGEYNLFVSL